MYRKKAIFTVIVAVMLVLSACARVDSQSTSGEAVDFTLETVGGGEISLADTLSRKNAVLVFFATWCPYCMEEVPHVNSYYAKNKAAVEVVGIDIQETRAKVANLVERKGITYPVALDTDGNVAASYGVRGIPAIIAINKEGKILYTGHSIEEMQEKTKF